MGARAGSNANVNSCNSQKLLCIGILALVVWLRCLVTCHPRAPRHRLISACVCRPFQGPLNKSCQATLPSTQSPLTMSATGLRHLARAYARSGVASARTAAARAYATTSPLPSTGPSPPIGTSSPSGSQPIPQPTFPGVTNPKPPTTGQPLAGSHAHVVRAGELTPGITAAEYEDRRRRLMDSLPPGSVVVCMGGTVRLVSQRELRTMEFELTRRDIVGLHPSNGFPGTDATQLQVQAR